HPHPATHHPPRFPTRRSSDLENVMDELSVGLSRVWAEQWVRTTSHHQEATVHARVWLERRPGHAPVQAEVDPRPPLRGHHAATTDRKSTRLNSSHVSISYAVF